MAAPHPDRARNPATNGLPTAGRPAWPLVEIGDEVRPAKVAIFPGLIEEDLEMGGKIRCAIADRDVPVEPGVGSLYLRHDLEHRAQPVGAQTMLEGQVKMRIRVLHRLLEHITAAQAEARLLMDDLYCLKPTDWGDRARKIDDELTLGADLAALISGTIVIVEGPPDPYIDVLREVSVRGRDQRDATEGD